MMENRPPRGMMLVHNYRPGPVGGAEIQAERLARGLLSLGHTMRILTNPISIVKQWHDFGPVDPWAPEHEIFYSDPAIPVSDLSTKEIETLVESGRAGVIERPPFRLTLKVWDVIDTFRFLVKERSRYDLLHCQMAYGHAVVATVVARVFGKRSIVKIACAGEFGELHDFSKFSGFATALNVLHKVDAVVAISREVEEELLRYGFSREKIVRIPNGVDTNHFRPSITEPSSEVIRFLLVGRRQPQKGVDLLLQAVSMLKSDPETASRFTVQLSGADSPYYDYRAMAADLGVADSVEFLPFQGDMRPIYSNVHCFVLPSRGEGLSNALLEAMACGLPSIATSVSGNPDVITNEKDGLLIPPESAEALAAAMKRIILDADLRRRLRVDARSRVENGYSLDHVTKEYSRLYSRLCGSPAIV